MSNAVVDINGCWWQVSDVKNKMVLVVHELFSAFGDQNIAGAMMRTNFNPAIFNA